VDGSPDERPAQIIDIGVRRRRTNTARKSEHDIAALQSGNRLQSPIVLLCHIRGEMDPFPRRWRFGSLSLGQGVPVWRPMRFPRRRGEPLPIPANVKAGLVRPVLREELSAFCPNPRKCYVVPLESAEGTIFVGMHRDSTNTLLAAIRVLHPPPRRRRGAGTSAAE
jgi:hypothetical protein